jgi:hypothetical protein
MKKSRKIEKQDAASSPIKRILLAAGGTLSAVMALTFACLAIGAQSSDKTTKPTDLTDITQLKEAFNRDSGSTRLILLLSPT